jgi:hypothetical protein
MNEIEMQAKRACQRAKLGYREARDAYEVAYARPEPEASPDGTLAGWEALCRERRDAMGQAWSAYVDARARLARIRAICEDAP